MKFTTIILFFSFVLGQSNDLPFDWSGQFGMTSINGRLFWNTDWTSGPLLFDGTFSHYPKRYGKNIINQFSPFTVHQIPLTNYTYPDSTYITTTLDYIRGDYNYDKLVIDVDYETAKRYAGLHLFKRSYAGREGQFFHPLGLSTPMQQSYKVDYRSQQNEWLIEAAAARFVTESGLPDSGDANGLLEDEILSTGLLTQSPSEKLQWTSHFAVFQQWRRMDVSWYSNRKKQFINRTRWHQQLGGPSFEGLNPLLGLDMNMQSISKNDSTSRNINWHTLYAQINLMGFKTSLGLTQIATKLVDYIAIDFTKSWDKFNIKALFEESSKPHHFNLISFGDGIVKNRFAHVKIKSVFGKANIGLTADYSSMVYDEKEYVTFQTGILVHTKLFKQFTFSGSYFNREGGTLLFDGIHDIATFDLHYSNKNVINRFALKMGLSGEGLLNREQSISFDPIDSFPYEYMVIGSNELADIWLLNAEVAVTISSMTITWSVRNILQAIEPTSLKLFPEKETGDFLIQHNPTFPSMGRLVMFGIHWTFKD
ncbi:MAG: hypothetical protein QGF82_04725 [Candidatus Marinimicrobia bacterium]|nr:hypothetical protein [Candidatus Neomarinimicrobiota bacterium]